MSEDARKEYQELKRKYDRIMDTLERKSKELDDFLEGLKEEGFFEAFGIEYTRDLDVIKGLLDTEIEKENAEYEKLFTSLVEKVDKIWNEFNGP